MSAQLGDRLELAQRIALDLTREGRVKLSLQPVDLRPEETQALEVNIGLLQGSTPNIPEITELVLQALDAFSAVYEAMGGDGLILVEAPT